MNVESETLPGGHRVIVEYDSDPRNPCKEWDQVGTVVLSRQSRYDFGHETASDDELRELSNDPLNICLPIYLYDHSGITISTGRFSCPWDSGLVGLIYTTKAKAAKEWSNESTEKAYESAIRCMEAEVKTLDQYLTGQVFGYRVFDPNAEEIDSCWGFYGCSKECLAEGIASAKYSEAEAEKEADEVEYWANRGIEK